MASRTDWSASPPPTQIAQGMMRKRTFLCIKTSLLWQVIACLTNMRGASLFVANAGHEKMLVRPRGIAMWEHAHKRRADAGMVASQRCVHKYSHTESQRTCQGICAPWRQLCTECTAMETSILPAALCGKNNDTLWPCEW